MTTETERSAERLIDAPAAVIFDILSNPERHPETDASGTVVSDEKTNRIKAVGDVFRMNMTSNAGRGREPEYQTDNHVTGFIENKLIAWRPGPTDADEPFGWEWLYELEPQGSEATLVRLSYRWGDVDKNTVNQVGLPKFEASDLEASLGPLASAVEAAQSRS